jgi:hypothetical protein
MGKTVMYTIQDAIKSALSFNELDLKAQVYLCLCKRDKRCKAYRKSLGKISKMQRKLNKEKKKKSPKHDRIKELENNIIMKRDESEALIEQVKPEQSINDWEMISSQLMRAYRQGLVVADSLKKLHSVNSSYGRLVYDIFKNLSKLNLWGRFKSAIKKDGETYFKRVIKNDPRLKKRDFLETEEGALLIESHFVIFLLGLSGQDISDSDMKDFTAELAAQIGSSDAIAKKISENFKRGYKLGEGLSKGGMEVFRIFNKTTAMAPFVAKGVALRVAIGHLVWLIPVIFQVTNRRDYLRLTYSILFFFLLRNSPELST